MTNMTVPAFVYWILGLQLTVIVSLVHTGDRRFNGHGIIGQLTPIVHEKSSPSPSQPTWLANQSTRNKRNGPVEDETILRRHARHRKRHRCRNRSTCSRSTYAPGLSLLRDDTIPADDTSKETKDDENNAVLETTEDLRDRLGVNKLVQEPYSETDAENYDVADTNVEKSFSKTSSDLPDSQDELCTPSGIECNSSDRSAQKKSRWKKDESENTDYIDEVRSLAVYSAMDDQVILHESLSVLLSKLFQSLRNATTDEQDILKQLNFVNGTNEDPCQKWLDSKDKLEQVFSGSLASLPACPCQYPSNIFYDDKIWDVKRMRYFRWRDASGDSQRLDVYKPGATYCILSLLTQGSGSAAVQHCCYDRRRKLLTRGSGAGTPNFVSPEISPVLHERIDVLPWRLCKGDFSRYNGVRPPNNGYACEPNPDDEEYQRQIDDTKHY